MYKKNISELVIIIILLALMVIGGFYWIYSKKNVPDNIQAPAVSEKQISATQSDENKNFCESHYYEGEGIIRGWKNPSDQNEEESIVIRIKDEDIEKLPIKNAKKSENFTVRLIDPTPQVKNSLNLSSEKNPVVIAVKGYAEICQQEIPQVSLAEAKIAFKRN